MELIRGYCFKLSVSMVMAEMPKFFGQMQNITVNNGTSKVTFTCALSGSIVGVHKVYYLQSLNLT